MPGYTALTEMYEWLMPDAKLTPAGSVAAFSEVVKPVAAHGRVLDCSCGTGQLAVGLAELGLDVVASDASPGMVHRTRLSFWPFRYEQLVAELESVGLTVDASTFNPEAEEYRVVARRAEARS